jgi:hypothetical protein
MRRAKTHVRRVEVDLLVQGSAKRHQRYSQTGPGSVMPEPLALRYDAVQLFDLGFGPHIVSVTAPGGAISPSSTLHPKTMGKAPGRLTQAGWTGLDLNNLKFRCLDYNVAKLWRDDWGANVGFVAGDGYFIIDNDQGRVFSEILCSLLTGYTKAKPLRRYVLSPGHERDAFLVRAVDFIGDGAPLANRTFKFRNGVKAGEVQLLAAGKQAVIAGVHPGARCPYAWSRALEGLDKIPVMSADQVENFFLEFVREAKSLGWDLEGPLTAPVSAAVSAPGVAIATESNVISPAKLLEAEALLCEIPNRDVPPGEAPNAIDRWLDLYENWTRIAYALAAFLGLALAQTPEALAIWVRWSDGRAQKTQTSESVWRSVLQALAQGQVRYGDIGLVKLVRSLVPAPGAAFPDLDPNDPLTQIKTPIWDMFRNRWAYCRSKGFIDMATGDVIVRQAFSDDNAHFVGALAAELHPRRRRGGAAPSVADMFVAQPSKHRVREITYAPGEALLLPTSDPDLPVFNRWRPTTHGNTPVSQAQVKPWLDHIEFVMGSIPERDRFVKWGAFVAQHPEHKPNWHFLVMAVQGLGKDTLVQPVKLAVGDGNWQECLIYKLSEQFNEKVETKFLIIGETRQSEFGFVSAHDTGTRLKELLARPPEALTINKKFKTPYEIPNRVAVVLFSNEENPLHLERDQRRVHVINRRGAKPEPAGYYQALWGWLNGGGAELAASYLRQFPLTDSDKNEFIGGVAPASDDKTELEHMNLHPALAELEEQLANAYEGVGPLKGRVATQSEIAEHVASAVKSRPSAQLVRTWLLDMERRKTGVHRARVDLKASHLAGLVGDGKYSGRLWLLGDTAADGRPWSALTNTEIVALWKNLPPPPNATVIKHPAAKFPDEEEPV